MLESVTTKIRNAEISNATTLSLLTGSDFDVLPEEIGRLRFLQNLVIQGTLRRLPAAIGGLKSLRSLQLLGCGLQELPPEIGSLGHLTEFNLGDNQLKSLPGEIGQLRSLQCVRENLSAAAH
jgi:Leucine-rich repeat (LRR) protein